MATKVVPLRVPEEEYAAWKLAAGDQPLSNWLLERIRVTSPKPAMVLSTEQITQLARELAERLKVVPEAPREVDITRFRNALEELPNLDSTPESLPKTDEWADMRALLDET